MFRYRSVNLLILVLMAGGCAEGDNSSGANQMPNLEVNGAGSPSTSSLNVSSESDVGALATSSPTNLKLAVYEFWVSEYGNCSDAIKVFSTTSPSYVDFLTSPQLGEGNAPTGTYVCVIMVMKDVIKYTPTSSLYSGTSEICVANLQYTSDVCTATVTTTITSPATLAASIDVQPLSEITSQVSETLCSAAQQIVPIYLSTWSSSTGGTSSNNPYKPPSSDGDATGGIRLSNPLVITGNSSGNFVVNGTDKIGIVSSACDMQPPIFSFEQN